jgi:hypothetical protein
MPIKPENLARYPKNWKSIRAKILERAGHKCEWDDCGVPNYSIGYWQDGKFVTDWAETMGDNGIIGVGAVFDGMKTIKIVLTIAHLDHTPENCAPENLKAWCQRHHLAYDHQHHLKNARITRHRRLGMLDMFEEQAG